MTREEFLERIDEIMCGTSNAERAYLEDLYDEVTKPHWISVEDRKPKLRFKDEPYQHSEEVIVTDGEARTSACWVHSTLSGWYAWLNGGEEELKGVTHWMPLPQPPVVSKTENTGKKGGAQ